MYNQDYIFSVKKLGIPLAAEAFPVFLLPFLNMPFNPTRAFPRSRHQQQISCIY